MQYNNATNWPSTEPEFPTRLEAVRLGVQSVLLSGDRNLPDISAELVGEVRGKRKLSPWGIAVMQEVFRQFNLEYQESQTDTARGQSSDDYASDDEDFHDALDQVVQIYYDEQDDGMELIPQYDPVIREIQEDEDIDHLDPRFTPPLSVNNSLDEACCLICSPKSPKRPNFSQNTPLTPPASPDSPYAKPRSFHQGCPECEAEASASSKSHSFIYAIKRQFRRHTSSSKLAQTPPSPKTKPTKPFGLRSTPAPPVHRAPSTVTKLSQGDDLRTVLRGPVLKINRLSDISLSLQLTAEELKQIEQRRALGVSEEEFDLVVRLGIPRPSRGNILAPFDDPPQPPPEIDVPPVPMIDPEHLQLPSPTAPTTKSAETARSKAASKSSGGKQSSGKRSTRLRRIKTSPSTIRTTPSQPVNPPPPEKTVIAVLSEENLAKLTKETGIAPPPIPESVPPPMPMLSRTKSGKSRFAPSEDTMSVITAWPAPPVRISMRKRVPLHKYPSVEQIPRAHTTALGLQGGRVGVVQMGSANKANKILGDIVLLAPDKEALKRKRTRGAPSVASGSVSKVERLRGERLPVERLHSVPYVPIEEVVQEEPGLRSPLVSMVTNRPKSNGAVWIV